MHDRRNAHVQGAEQRKGVGMMAVDQIARMMALDAAQSGGGGGGGTDNYNDLTNRPKINGVTLTGNKTTSALGIVENVQADWDEADITAPSYIQNKPNIPSGVVVDTTYDGTSQNAQAGTAVAQAISTKVDKVTGKGLSENDYTDADKEKLDGIETGAEANVQADWNQTDSSAEDFIKNKPNIPTVNDATLTIQKNGTAVGTFSANSATAATINITVPVDAEDVDALPGTTKYGASLALSIDSSTYVVTATLKDQDGNVLGTAQTIDLPLETVVVGGSYDDTTKKVILTLKNGNTIDFSVADLVAGLQTEITSTNKLDADLVDDTTSAHKFVTAADKAAWNAKSDFSGDYDDLTNKPTIPAAQVNADWNAVSGVAQILNKPTIPTPVTVDQTYNAQSANAQSGTAVAQALLSAPGVLDKVFTAQYTVAWATTQVSRSFDFDLGVALSPNKMYVAVVNTESTLNGSRSSIQTRFITNVTNDGSASFSYNMGANLGSFYVDFSSTNGKVYAYYDLPAQTDVPVSQNHIIELYEVTGLILNNGITSTDYATQTTGGTIKAWTTTDGSDTILHLATQ